jgi:hypothetical protein
MIKKILTGVILAVTTVILVAGGIHRTLEKTATDYGTRASRDNRSGNLETHFARGEDAAGPDGYTGAERQTGQLNLAGTKISELVTLTGTVSSADLGRAVLIDTTGGQLALQGRALSFAVSQGFMTDAGDRLLLEGFYEGADFEIMQISNQTNGQVTALRDAGGRPLWAGGQRAW